MGMSGSGGAGEAAEGRERMRVRRSIVIGAVAALALVTGVSSASVADGHGPGHPLGRPHGTDPVRAAKKEFAKYHRTQPGLDIPQLPARPPSGKRLVVTTCSVAVCHLTTDPAIAAAKELGWTVQEVELPLTGVQPVIDMWNTVLQDPPDAMVYEGTVADSQVQSYIDRAAAAGVKIVDAAPKGTAISASGPIYAQVNGPSVLTLSGRLMGDAVVSSARHGRARTVWITDPNRAFFTPAQTAFAAVVRPAGGTVDTLGISLADVGIGVPAAVVSYVRSHPSVRYLAFALNDMTVGVPVALKAAGLDKQVRIISRAPTAAGVQDIQTGRQWASVTEEVGSAGWRNVDQLVRILTGVPLTDELRDPVGWHMIVDRSNVGRDPAGPQVAGLPSAFLAAWHLTLAGY